MTISLQSGVAAETQLTAEALQREWQGWKKGWSRFMDALDAQEVPYLSYSKVSTVERCPRCYYNQYILRQELSSTALTTGSLFHRAAEAFYDALRLGQPFDAPAVAQHLRPKHTDPTQQAHLENAIKTLRQNAWEGYEIVATEELIFLDLAPRLPPVIGVADLVLRKAGSYVVVDHKTSKRFNDPDPAQLVLYAKHVRQRHGASAVVGAFDEYRLVPDLKRVRKPVFRRTPVSVDPAALAPLIARFRRAWKLIATIHRDRHATPSPDCYTCNPPSYGSNWY